MKKLILILILVLMLILSGCGLEPSYHYEEQEFVIVDKHTAIESEYIFFLEKYKTYTAYYLILENGEVEEVSLNEYSKYQIGDTYTIKVKVVE